MCIFKYALIKEMELPAHLGNRTTAKPILSLLKKVIESSGIQRANVQVMHRVGYSRQRFHRRS